MSQTQQKETFQDIIRGDKPVLVDFFAEWCGPCKMMAPTLKQLAERAGDKVRIVKVDIDRSRSAANQYQIQSVPTLILFHKGKIVWRQSGVQPLHKLEALVKQHAG
ncbi:thioredoxin [Nibrella viscosa]|uniref:Thioredoxin n=1 Tax=Nibrella viscosa TaxID=1084524 RepID=A0ABP8KVH9_9BACT